MVGSPGEGWASSEVDSIVDSTVDSTVEISSVLSVVETSELVSLTTPDEDSFSGGLQPVSVAAIEVARTAAITRLVFFIKTLLYV